MESLVKEYDSFEILISELERQNVLIYSDAYHRTLIFDFSYSNLFYVERFKFYDVLLRTIKRLDTYYYRIRCRYDEDEEIYIIK